MKFVRLVDFDAVDVNLFVNDADAVAGHADDALDVVLFNVEGITENDNIAALDRLVGQQMPADAAAGGVGQLVDDQMVAGHEGVFHRRSRNDEWLGDRAGAEHQEHDREGPFRDGAGQTGRRSGGIHFLSGHCPP